jgi:D-inositol-3-phosphate glycosyltransferase
MSNEVINPSNLMNRKKSEKKKIKVLAYCDSPTCATGFGTVSRNILLGLYATGLYDVDILGINYWGEPHNFPFRIWPVGTNSENDPYGRKKVFNMIQRMDFDMLFFLQDTFIMDFLPDLHTVLGHAEKKFKSIVYYPIDGTPKSHWLRNVDACNYLVAYSNFGKEASLRALPGMKEPMVIPHGVNTHDYYVIPDAEREAFRKQYFGGLSDTFIFTNLNRNQQRKDIPRTIAAFVEFRKHVKDSTLYLHMAKEDQGWKIKEILDQYGLDMSKDVIMPENFGPNQGYPIHIVNLIYNASDCIVSTTLGEGFGLSWIEGLATRTPIIMPNNTMMPEFITEDRGWLADSGTNPSLFTVIPHDNEVIRPLVDVDSMVKCMLEVHNNPEEANRRASIGHKWITESMSWGRNVVPMWTRLFNKAYGDLVEEQSTSVPKEPEVGSINSEVF